MNASVKAWLLALALLPLIACSGKSDPIAMGFDDAWVRSVPPGAMMTAGFGRLVNSGTSSWELKSISSPAFDDVSLHQTVTEDGMTRMRGVSELALGAGEILVLEPGGYHLMFMRAGADIPETITVTFELKSGQTFTFDLPIESR